MYLKFSINPKGLLFTVLLFTVSCASKKNVSEDMLYSPEWVMEYISGPGVALEELFNDTKPTIQFDKKDQRVFGSTGCNGYTAGFSLQGHAIRFGNPGPTTLMYCGEGEELFKKAMQEVDSYSVSEDGKLFLMKGKTPLLRFKKL